MLKNYRPITPGTRGLSLISRDGLHKGSPIKSLVKKISRTGGRNNLGRITVRGVGGGKKRSYRLVDFKRSKVDMYAVVQRIEYDPNRTAFIALICYEDQTLSYILAPTKLSVGDKVISSEQADILPGNSLKLKNIPVGTIVHAIELKPNKGAQFCRAAGTFAQILGRDGRYVVVKLSSGEVRLFEGECRASIGVLSNLDNANQNYGKAGRVRLMGCRPKVRGVAMNPIDHPHGGGEGRTSGGRHPVSYSGVLAKGKKTRLKKVSPLVLRKRK